MVNVLYVYGRCSTISEELDPFLQTPILLFSVLQLFFNPWEFASSVLDIFNSIDIFMCWV